MTVTENPNLPPRMGPDADIRALVFGGTLKAATPTQPARGWGWWLMAASLYLFAIIVGYAMGMRDTERRYADVPNPEGLEQRITDVEASNHKLQDRFAVLDGEVDDVQKIIGDTEETK